jgi:hypothetical protein
MPLYPYWWGMYWWGPYMPYVTLIVLIAMMAALVDIVGGDGEPKGMPRWGWLLLVIILPLVGSVVWFLAGRPRSSARRRPTSTGAGSLFPEYDRKGRFVPEDPVADAEFLQRCRERAEAQRREAELERRRRQREW